RGDIAVTFTVGDLLPGLIAVGKGVRAGAPDSLRIVRPVLREVVTAKVDPETGLVSWRTRARLPRGVYRVQVSGVLSDGITSCFPHGADCTQRWSNVRRVVVR